MRILYFTISAIVVLTIGLFSLAFAVEDRKDGNYPLSYETVGQLPLLLAQSQPQDQDERSGYRPQGTTRRVAQNNGPGKAHAAGRKPAPSPQGARDTPPPSAAPAPTAQAPWERGKVYDAGWRKSILEGQGWYVTECRDRSGNFFNPKRFNIVGRTKELFNKAQRDLHHSAAAKHGGKKSYKVESDVSMAMQLMRQLHREGIEEFVSDVLKVIPVSGGQEVSSEK